MSSALEEQKPKRLLDNALAFYEAGRRCAAPSKTSFPPHKEAVLYSPSVVCQAFAIEQFLNCFCSWKPVDIQRSTRWTPSSTGSHPACKSRLMPNVLGRALHECT